MSQHCWTHRPARGIAPEQLRANLERAALAPASRPETVECHRCGVSLVHWVGAPLPTPGLPAAHVIKNLSLALAGDLISDYVEERTLLACDEIVVERIHES